jgi:hypothetical protein
MCSSYLVENIHLRMQIAAEIGIEDVIICITEPMVEIYLKFLFLLWCNLVIKQLFSGHSSLKLNIEFLSLRTEYL